MLPARIAVPALIAVAFAGCADEPTLPKRDTNASSGATNGSFGMVIGSRVIGSRAAVGGVAGTAVGASLDEQDRQRANAAEIQALETGAPGAPVGWRSEHGPYHGTVVPGPYYYSGGMRCRSYTHTVYIGDRPQALRATACRNSDGSWTAVG
jgi:surface antigen